MPQESCPKDRVGPTVVCLLSSCASAAPASKGAASKAKERILMILGVLCIITTQKTKYKDQLERLTLVNDSVVVVFKEKQ